MVNINTVYTTVQAIINKEQRGYIAPVEFNKFAGQAQREIFEAYFFDDAHFSLSPKGMSATSVSNIKMIIQEKIDVFSAIAEVGTNPIADVSYNAAGRRFVLPTNLYRLGTIYYNNGTLTQTVPMIMKDQLQYTLNSPLTAPSLLYPKYIRWNNDEIRVYPIDDNDALTDDDKILTGIEVHYIKIPALPVWGYQEVGAKRQPTFNPALIDADTQTRIDLGLPTTSGTVHFEVHESEQYLLVEKILQYAGIQIKQAEITQFAAQDEAGDNANKKQ